MMSDYGVGALGGVVLIDPVTGLPYKAEGGGGGAVSSVNGQTGEVVLTAADVNALPDSYTPPSELPTPPTEGTFNLQSVDGVLTWVEAV